MQMNYREEGCKAQKKKKVKAFTLLSATMIAFLHLNCSFLAVDGPDQSYMKGGVTDIYLDSL